MLYLAVLPGLDMAGELEGEMLEGAGAFVAGNRKADGLKIQVGEGEFPGLQVFGDACFVDEAFSGDRDLDHAGLKIGEVFGIELVETSLAFTIELPGFGGANVRKIKDGRLGDFLGGPAVVLKAAFIGLVAVRADFFFGRLVFAEYFLEVLHQARHVFHDGFGFSGYVGGGEEVFELGIDALVVDHHDRDGFDFGKVGAGDPELDGGVLEVDVFYGGGALHLFDLPGGLHGFAVEHVDLHEHALVHKGSLEDGESAVFNGVLRLLEGLGHVVVGCVDYHTTRKILVRLQTNDMAVVEDHLLAVGDLGGELGAVHFEVEGLLALETLHELGFGEAVSLRFCRHG